MIDSLAMALKQDNLATEIMQGEVTVASPLTVRFEGTAVADAVTGVVALSTYTPAVNDTVLLLRFRGTWIALGALA